MNEIGSEIVHVTTRQDIQIHEVNIEDTPDVLEGLLEVGLSSRGGCSGQDSQAKGKCRQTYCCGIA